MTDLPPAIFTPSGAGSPVAPGGIFTPSTGGGSPDAPDEVFTPTAGGGSAVAPGGIFTPSTGGESPVAPGGIFTPSTGGGSPTAPSGIFTPSTGGGSPAAPSGIFTPSTNSWPNYLETNFPNANNDIRFEQVNPAIVPSVIFAGNPSGSAAPVAIFIDSSPEQVVVIVKSAIGLTVTTANQVIDAINAHPAASALMRAMPKAGNTGAAAIGDYSSMITRHSLSGGGVPAPPAIFTHA